MHGPTIDLSCPSRKTATRKCGWLAGLALLFTLQLVGAMSAHAAEDALDEVNAVRAKRGLPKFVRDEGLSEAAAKCAEYRAARLISGHTSNDFSFVPTGSSASAAGCAAWPADLGWGACCTYENWKTAGAAWARGRDGRRYMHLFVRGGGDGKSSSTTSASYSGRRGRR
jgi:hypothetical protein